MFLTFVVFVFLTRPQLYVFSFSHEFGLPRFCLSVLIHAAPACFPFLYSSPLSLLPLSLLSSCFLQSLVFLGDVKRFFFRLTFLSFTSNFLLVNPLSNLWKGDDVLLFLFPHVRIPFLPPFCRSFIPHFLLLLPPFSSFSWARLPWSFSPPFSFLPIHLSHLPPFTCFSWAMWRGLSLVFPSSYGFETRFWFVFRWDGGFARFRCVSVLLNTGSSRIPAPIPPSGDECMSAAASGVAWSGLRRGKEREKGWRV